MPLLLREMTWPLPHRLHLVMPLLALLGCGLAADAQPNAGSDVATAGAEAPAPASNELTKAWVRIERSDDDTPLAMQTAIVRFVPAGGYVEGKDPADYPEYIDLVGVVHIGDRHYYDSLNARFSTYDAVLYELVAPEGTVVPRGRGTSNSHPLGALQNAMKSSLEVEHQLEQVDYTRPNFVHADLSPDQFIKTMEDRGETFLELFLRIASIRLAEQKDDEFAEMRFNIELAAALAASDPPRRLKIMLAKQFEGMETLTGALAGPDGTTLITGRNTRALDVAEVRLKKGDKKLAVFYGAGHMTDMTDQLEKRFDMRPVSCEWLEAWDLRVKD